MNWNEIRAHLPSQWLLVEATTAHSEDNRRILDDIAVVAAFPNGKSAMDAYIEIHGTAPQRELYVLSTHREELDIEELHWLTVFQESPNGAQA